MVCVLQSKLPPSSVVFSLYCVPFFSALKHCTFPSFYRFTSAKSKHLAVRYFLGCVHVPACCFCVWFCLDYVSVFTSAPQLDCRPLKRNTSNIIDNQSPPSSSTPSALSASKSE